MKASKKRYKCEEAFLSKLFVWIVVIHNEEEQNITIDGPDSVWKKHKIHLYPRSKRQMKAILWYRSRYPTERRQQHRSQAAHNERKNSK